MSWKERIEAADEVCKKLHQADIQGLWEYHEPNAAATELELKGCEQDLGFILDSDYRGFLGNANGWRRFYRDYDLFNTQELVTGPKLRQARSILETQRTLKSEIGCDHDDLLIIAMDMVAIGLLVIAKPQSCCPGKVFWIDGAMLEEFSDFTACFMRLCEVNREDHDEFIDENGLDLPKFK
jgi:hypothetical protein